MGKRKQLESKDEQADRKDDENDNGEDENDDDNDDAPTIESFTFNENQYFAIDRGMTWLV